MTFFDGLPFTFLFSLTQSVPPCSEILREIQRIREEQMKTQQLGAQHPHYTTAVSSSGNQPIPGMSSMDYVMHSPQPYGAGPGAPLMTGELSALKYHRDKLESRMGDLKV